MPVASRRFWTDAALGVMSTGCKVNYAADVQQDYAFAVHFPGAQCSSVHLLGWVLHAREW
jgi:hypothetical protein